MIWRDLVVSSNIAIDQIVSALSSALKCDPSQILFSESIENIPEDKIFCLRSQIPEGQYTTVLSIYTAAPPTDDNLAISDFANALGDSVLASDDETSDPYTMKMFAPGRNPRSVKMVERELDKGIYTIDQDDIPLSAYSISRPAAVQAPGTCPVTGYWTTPAHASSRRRFEAGETMPALATDYGATIWQWDERQD